MKLFAVTLPAKRADQAGARMDPEIAEQVGQEILKNRLEPAAWANALAVSGGKRQDALAAYARIRLQQLASRNRMRRAKARSFEARRLNTCLGIKTVQDLLDRSNRGGQLNLAKPRLSLVWLGIFFVGSAGTIASLGRLLGESLPDRLERWIPVIALMGGSMAVAGTLVLRATLPKRWVMLGWNLGMTAACTTVCFGSLCFGAKLIAKTSPDVIQQITSRPAATAADRPRGGVPVLVKPRLAPVGSPKFAAADESGSIGE